MLKSERRGAARAVAAAGLGLTLALGAAPMTAFADPGTGTQPSSGQVSGTSDATGVKTVAFDGGEGTEESPYLISSAETLAAFAQSVNSGTSYSGRYIKLSGNINLSAYGSWMPIGTKDNPFSGTFDGGNHTVTGLRIEDKSLSFAGLFGRIVGGTITNLTISNPYVAARSYVGALVGDAYTGSVSNCTVTGDIQVYGHYKVGGLTGNGYASIAHCMVTGSDESSVRGTYLEPDLEGDSVGGLIGYRGEGAIQIEDCSVSGLSVFGTRKVGGLVGSAYTNNTIKGCTVENASVVSEATLEYAADKSSSMGVGGLIGIIVTNGTTPGSVTDCKVSNITLDCINDVAGNVKMGYVTGGMYANGVSAPTEKQMKLSVVVTGTNSGANVDAPGLNGAVASVEGEYYNTLAEALGAVETGGKVTLLRDTVGSGVVVDGDSERTFTLDLGGHTYTVTDPTVGSSGTKTNGFQLLQGSTITIKNGTITTNTDQAKILIQNYSNLKLENVNLIGGRNTQYTLSNNCGDVTIGAKTNITAGQAQSGIAFDVCRFSSYPSVHVTVAKDAGKITGKIELSASNNEVKEGFSLTVEGGDFTDASIVVDKGGNLAKVKKDSSVDLPAPEGYQWVDEGNGPELAPVSPEGDEDPFVAVATIGDVKYDSLQAAIDAAQPGQTVELLDNVEVETWNMVWGVKGVTIDGKGHTLTVNNIDSNGNHNALVQSDGGNTVRDLTVDLSELVSTGNGMRAFSAGPGDTYTNVTIKGNENLEYGISVGGTAAGGETVVIDGCSFSDAGYGVYDSEDGSVENLVIKGSSFTDCDYAVILRSPNASFTGNTVDSGKLNIMKDGQIVDGNTFKDDSCIKFYASPESFEKNIISADSSLDVDSDLDNQVDVSENYWGGGAPSMDQLGNAAGSVTGTGVYYERPTMRPQDLNTYVPPSTPSGDAVKVEQSDGGKVTVTPTRADEGDEVTITATPDEGQEVRSVSVVDADGKAVTVKAGEKDGEYVFTMPDGAVTVTVTFGCDGGELCPTHGFNDVDQDAWYHDAVDWAVENGVLNGYGEGGESLGPVADVTRAEMAQMLWNRAGRPGAEADLSAFTDVSADGWYAPALAWCVSEGIFSGYGDTFGTERTISREEATTVLWRIAGSPEADADLSGYGDASSVSDYATGAIEWAVSTGVLTGKGNVALDPQAGCTRGEVAAMMMRMAK